MTETLPDGRAVRTVDLEGGGLRARVSALGAALVELWAPDAEGTTADVALGHGPIAAYVGDPAFLGVAVGRTAGRVADARVTVDGRPRALEPNDGPNTLHGGPRGLHSRVWTVLSLAPDAVTLAARSLDGEGGFPGRLDVRLTYTLAGGALRLDWHATAAAPTPLAVTHHGYWNLDGHDAGSVADHRVQVGAGHVVDVGPDLLPTGRYVPVAGTALDLRRPVRLGDVGAGHPLFAVAGGLDLDWVAAPDARRQRPLRRVARVQGRRRRLDVWTTEPGVHLYGGAGLDVATGKGDARYGPASGLAIETQPPPDAGRHPAFPDVVLRPGQVFRSRTDYRFSPL